MLQRPTRSRFHSTKFAAKRSAATGGAYLVTALAMFALCAVLSWAAKGEDAGPPTIKVDVIGKFHAH